MDDASWLPKSLDERRQGTRVGFEMLHHVMRFANARRPARLTSAVRLVATASIAGWLSLSCATIAFAKLDATARTTLVRYVNDLALQRYDDAFALLAANERRYFGTVAHFRSAYDADGLRIASYRIVSSTADPPHGSIAIVAERIAFFDHAHQRTTSASARVPYGLVVERGVARIRDPYHPWKALAPRDVAARVAGLDVLVRKVSFFTGRVEIVATFVNRSGATITLLPYGKTVLHDEAARALRPLATATPALTDRVLYAGLRLAPSAEYTGALTFATPDRYAPHRLRLTVAPALADGADAPFDIPLPAFDVPA